MLPNKKNATEHPKIIQRNPKSNDNRSKLLEKLVLSRLEDRTAKQARIKQQTKTHQSKIELKKAKAELGLWEERILFLCGIASIGIVGALCIYTILSRHSSPDDKKWATTILASIASGIIAYITGKSSK